MMASLLPSSYAGSQVVAPGSSHAQVTTVAAGTLKARLGQFSHTGGLRGQRVWGWVGEAGKAGGLAIGLAGVQACTRGHANKRSCLHKALLLPLETSQERQAANRRS